MIAQAVDKPHDRDRLNFEGLGHFRLGHAFLARQTREHAPLRASHAVFASALVDVGAHDAGNIGKVKKNLATRVKCPFHKLIVSMLINAFKWVWDMGSRLWDNCCAPTTSPRAA